MWQFDPTAGQTDFDQVPGLRAAWQQFINDYYEHNLYGTSQDTPLALQELRKWGRSDADLRFYNPLSVPVPDGSEPDNVFWKALPTSFDDRFGDDKEALFSFLDERQSYRGIITRIQDEYNEWRVIRDQGNKIRKIIFTSEPPEYYQFLWDDPYEVGRQQTQELLLQLYRDRCGDPSVQLADLADVNGNYNWYNKWNNAYCVHMQQPNNTLGAQINIAARSSILRMRVSTGELIEDAQTLIKCAEFGAAARQSDPAIGFAVNLFARENRFVTLENPVGLYMTRLDTTGWSSPDGTNPQMFWKVIKGKDDSDPRKAIIVRAEYAVPDDKSYTVSEIKIGGEAIRYGAQVAANLEIRLGVLKSPPMSIPKPRSIGCLSDQPTPSPMFISVAERSSR